MHESVTLLCDPFQFANCRLCEVNMTQDKTFLCPIPERLYYAHSNGGIRDRSGGAR